LAQAILAQAIWLKLCSGGGLAPSSALSLLPSLRGDVS